MHDDILDNLHDNVFYHGTFAWAAEDIVAGGFQDRVVLDEGEVHRHWGTLGYGVYVTCDLPTALFFRRNGVVLQVKLARGTRIVTCGPKADARLIASLKREFGSAIIRQAPWKVLPRNKQLKLHEAIALVRYHYDRWTSLAKRREGRREDAHWQLMMQMKPILGRHGIDGFGHPANDLGIVVFGADRVIPVGLVSPDQIDTATLKRAREHPGAEEVDAWLHSCQTPEFRELAAKVAAYAAANHSASMPRSASDARKRS